MPAKNVTGRRIGAAFIDLALYTALCFAFFFLLADSTTGSVLLDSTNINLQLGDRTWYVEGGEAGLVYLLDLAGALVYFGLLPGLTGWTPGKLVTGLRVVRADRRRAGVGRNLVRPFAWIADGFPYFLPGLVGFVMVLATREHRRVADFVAGTYVVDRAEAGRARAAPAVTASPAAAAAWYPDPSGAPLMRCGTGSTGQLIRADRVDGSGRKVQRDGRFGPASGKGRHSLLSTPNLYRTRGLHEASGRAA